MTCQVSKEMSSDSPRRIVRLPSEVHVPLPANCPQREALEQAALNCPVHKSLPNEIERPSRFFWDWDGHNRSVIPSAAQRGRRIPCALPVRFR